MSTLIYDIVVYPSLEYLFYGGSFDPVHLGHVNLLKLAQATFPDKPIVVVPTGHTPFKNKPKVGFRHRVKMARLAFESLSPRFSLLEKLISPSYTVQTLLKIKNYCKGKPILLIGADQLKLLKSWHKSEYLIANFEFIVARRPGFYHHNYKEIKIRNWLDIDYNVSSTLIRKKISNGDIDWKGYLPNSVASYILEKNLYGCKDE